MASAPGCGYTRGGRGPKCPAIIILRRIWRSGSRRWASSATRRCDPQELQTKRESNGKVRCFSYDQTADRGGRPALLHLLHTFRPTGLMTYAERRNARARTNRIRTRSMRHDSGVSRSQRLTSVTVRAQSDSQEEFRSAIRFAQTQRAEGGAYRF